MLAEHVSGDLDHDVIGVDVGLILVALEALQTGRAGGENFDLAFEAVGAGGGRAFLHLFGLAESDLRADIGPSDGKRTGLTATAGIVIDAAIGVRIHELVDDLEGLVLLHRRVARVVVHVAHAGDTLQAHVFFHEEFVDVDDARTGEDLVEFIALQLVVAGATAHHHGLDVEVVECVRDAMKEHAIIGDDFFGLVKIPGAALRIAAAKISGRQHGLHAHVPEHGLSGEPHLREQALGAAAREVKDGFGFGRGGHGIADHRDVVFVFDVEQRTGGFLGHPCRHATIDEVHDLLADRRFADRGGRRLDLGFGQRLEELMTETLRLETPLDHALAHELDRLGVGRIQKQHRRCCARIEALFTHPTQQITHRHRHIAKVDVHRTR